MSNSNMLEITLDDTDEKITPLIYIYIYIILQEWQKSSVYKRSLEHQNRSIEMPNNDSATDDNTPTAESPSALKYSTSPYNRN